MTNRSALGRIALAALVLLVSLSWSARGAQACSPPVCRAGSFFPAAETKIPANAPALIHLPGQAASVPDAPSGEQLHSQVELVTQAGAAVPFTNDTQPHRMLLRPTAGQWPLGTLRVRRPELCTDTGLVTIPPPLVEHSFSVTGPVPLPTAIGTVHADHSRVERLTVSHDGLCTTEIRAAVVTLTIRPTPELRAFLPLAEINVYHRTLEHPDVLNHAWARKSDKDPLTMSVYASCEAERPGFVGNGLTPGLHQLEVVASIAGVDLPLPGIRLVVDLDCDDSALGCSLARTAAPASPFLAITGALLLATMVVGPIRRRLRHRRRHPPALDRT